MHIPPSSTTTTTTTAFYIAVPPLNLQILNGSPYLHTHNNNNTSRLSTPLKLPRFATLAPPIVSPQASFLLSLHINKPPPLYSTPHFFTFVSLWQSRTDQS